jgi:serine protease AprX
MGTTAPDATVETIVQFDSGTTLEQAEADVRAVGLTPGARIPLIHGLAVEMPAKHAKQLAAKAGVRVISLNSKVKPQGVTVNASYLANAYDSSVDADKVWNSLGPSRARASAWQ